MYGFAQIRALYLGAAEKVMRGSFQNNVSVLQNVTARGDLKREVCILLDHKDSNALRLNRNYCFENAVYE